MRKQRIKNPTIDQVQPGDWVAALTRDVQDLPTKPGTVGRATVRGVPNVRIMLLAGVDEWISAVPVSGWVSHHHEDDIDASTFVLELEGDDE